MHCIASQFRAIVAILIAGGYRIYPLPKQIEHAVGNQVRTPFVADTQRDDFQQFQSSIGFPEKQESAICANLPPVKRKLYTLADPQIQLHLLMFFRSGSFRMYQSKALHLAFSVVFANTDCEPNDRAFVLSRKLLWYHSRE
jgi:hypothetical protein